MKERNTREKKDKEFIVSVMNYYKKSGRHTLPWRQKNTPYHILVSELMLQQTQVSRVIPKFKLWVKTYPSLRTLQQAKLQDILLLWQGLGYQRRAKALYQIGKTMSSIPKNETELLSLPGVGHYTAHAILAFAYNTESYPLEINIKTALIHHFHKNKRTHIDDTVLYTDLRRLFVYEEIRTYGARTWYSALMDYGAHLKETGITYNQKIKGYTKQTTFKGSLRELRAKVLFAITHGKDLPKDDSRIEEVLSQLEQEGFIERKNKSWILKE